MKQVATIAVFLILPFLFLTPSYGMGFCPSSPNGQCPKPRAWKPDHREHYTEAQRNAMWEKFNRACMNKYGNSHLVEIDYYTRRYLCGF